MTPSASTAPRALFVFSVYYGGMVCLAGVMGNKQVTLGPLSGLGELVGIGPLAVEAGIFVFLQLVVIASAIAELYGTQTAGRLVRFGLVPLAASPLIGWFVLALPASPAMKPENITAFQLIIGQNLRIWIGGIVAYAVSQLLNITLFSWLKRGSALLWLRAGLASIASQIVDTLIFVTIAFLGTFPIGALLVGQMLAKVALSALIVPPLIYAVVALGRRLDRAG